MLRNTQNPLFSLIFQVIVDVEILVDDVDDGLDAVTLVDSRCLVQDQKGHSLRQNFIVLTQVLDQIKVLGLEVYYLGHKCVELHTLVFHVIQFIPMLDQ